MEIEKGRQGGWKGWARAVEDAWKGNEGRSVAGGEREGGRKTWGRRVGMGHKGLTVEEGVMGVG